MVHNFSAVIFDLDGVITDTARIHSFAWKQLFDEYLRNYSRNHGFEFRPFSLDSDYLIYVDGKDRYQGVDCFLRSRGINLPFGSPSDVPGIETVCGLGNKKDKLFGKTLRIEGVKIFKSTLNLIHRLKAHQILCAVVSSSKNCNLILELAKINSLFDVKIDGIDAFNLGLNGKPSPDTFLKAAQMLHLSAGQCVVIEDALSGVQAAVKGKFGCVVGVDRNGIGAELRINGADFVIKDLIEISLENIQEFFVQKKILPGLV